MPESCHEHRDDVVDIHADSAATIASEGYVEIVTEPRGERYVPTAPEVGKAERTVREPEVVRKPETEYGCRADTEVAITREVEINLDGIAHKGCRTLEAREALWTVEHPTGELSDIVSEHVLLHHAEHDEPKSHPYHTAGRLLIAAQTWDEVLGAGDWSGKQQREERQIKHKLQQRGIAIEAATIDVHGVTDGLERVERDAHRQRYRGKGEVGGEHRSYNVVHEERSVLEVAEHSEVNDDEQREQCLAGSSLTRLHLLRKSIVEARRGWQQPHQRTVEFIGKEEVEGNDV